LHINSINKSASLPSHSSASVPGLFQVLHYADDDDFSDLPELVRAVDDDLFDNDDEPQYLESAPADDPLLSPKRRAPIRPAAKPPKGKRRKNVFVDDRGFPDVSDKYDTLLDNIEGRPVLRKRRHPA
jgi:hypothetical protein